MCTAKIQLKHNLKAFSTSTFALHQVYRFTKGKEIRYAIWNDYAVLHTPQFIAITNHSDAVQVFPMLTEVSIPRTQIQYVHACLQEMYSEDRLVQIYSKKNQTRVVVLEGFAVIDSWYLTEGELKDSFLLSYPVALFVFNVLAKATDEHISLGYVDGYAVFHTSLFDLYVQAEPFNVYSYN